MVAPAALAETVTPPIFSPAADVTVPVSRASAASAALVAKIAALSAVASAIRLIPMRLRALAMAFLLVVFARRTLRPCRCRLRRRSRHGLEISRDRGDLIGVVGIFEARHARRAVGDDVADHILA